MPLLMAFPSEESCAPFRALVDGITTSMPLLSTCCEDLDRALSALVGGIPLSELFSVSSSEDFEVAVFPMVGIGEFSVSLIDPSPIARS
jgi:hypothetical protein